MAELRKTDLKSASYFRSERFFLRGFYWYFKTRENIEYGPYASKEEAFIELQKFLRFKKPIEEIKQRWKIEI
ncbi:MAG: DUF6316 family protein [Pseudomonadota bacterium]